jgi:hypothetical protein
MRVGWEITEILKIKHRNFKRVNNEFDLERNVERELSLFSVWSSERRLNSGCKQTNKLTPSPLARKRTIPMDRQPLVGEILCQLLRLDGCRVVSAADPPRSLILVSRPEPLLFFQVAPHLSPQGSVDRVPDPLLLGKSGSAENRTRDLWVSSQELWSQRQSKFWT